MVRFRVERKTIIKIQNKSCDILKIKYDAPQNNQVKNRILVLLEDEVRRFRKEIVDFKENKYKKFLR